MTLLTTDDYRALHSTALEDPALQLLLDAAEADIVAYAGPDAEIVEWFGGGQRVIALARPAASIASIVESGPWGSSPTTLSADDYLLDPGGYLLYRDANGTNPRWRWWGRVVVTYTPVGEEDRRMVVQADLVFLAETVVPGVTSETVGAWTRELASNSQWNGSAERATILERLASPGRMVVVGG